MLITKLTTQFIITLLALTPLFSLAQLSPKEAISQMKKGINLGNTLEPPREGEWGNPTTQEYMFDMYKKEGFDCIRIPVRWDKHTTTTSPYKIDETWFRRVEQILDWGLSRGLYIVVNTHHDNWIKEAYSNPLNQARFDSIWSQVATRFRNKSEKLIFEICNEPFAPMTKAQNDAMHQNAIKVIRKSNPTRLIIFQGIGWGGSEGLIDAAIPNDKYIIGSFHSYDPYLFGLEGKGEWGSTSDINVLKAKFQTVKDWSVKNDIPVFLGEFGSLRTCDYNSRMKHYKTYVELAHSFGFASCAWDDGGDFRIMNRAVKTWDDDVKDILAHSSELSPKFPRLSLFQDTIVRLLWNNPATNYDSIYIERRLSNTTFKRVAKLAGSETSFNDPKLPQNKDYYYRVIAHFNNGTNLYSYPQKIFLPTYIPKPPVLRQLFTGKALEIPGKIEAENFDIGEDGMTYHDSDAKNISGALRPTEPIDIYDLGGQKYFVIDNYPGEWLEYTVNVAQKGTYDISASIAAFAGGGTFKIKIGAVESAIIKAPGTNSWTITKPVTFSLDLEVGTQIMRLSFIDKPLFYLDYLEFNRRIPVGNQQLQASNPFLVRQDKHGFTIHSSPDHSVKSYALYNILGSEVKTGNTIEPSFRISTKEFRSGVYILKLTNDNRMFSQKIIIE